MVDFSSLKRDRASALAAINDKAKAMANNTPAEAADAGEYWTPSVDEAGNGSAIIRFLPASPGESDPFVRYWNHAFKGPGGWYIENSLTTIGQPDPVSEFNKELWDTGTKENQDRVRAQKRKLHYVSNIYVIKDPMKPETEGKVYKYKYGKKIFDKIMDQLTPDELDDDAVVVNPFDMWEGANFRLKIRQVEGYRNYDKSEFDKPSEFLKNDKDREAVWNSQYKLSEVTSPDKFKSYDELKTRLYKVLGLTGNKPATQTNTTAPWDDEPTTAAAPSAGRTKAAPAPSPITDDDDIGFFQRLSDD